MARTPQFTRAEAESLIGPRGNLKVTVANRRDVRKWLVACGISSSVVGALPLATLQAAYNDVSGAVLVDLKRNGAPREKTEAEKLEEWTQFGEQARNAGRSRDSCPAIFAQYRAAWLDGYDRAASETPKQEETPKMDTPAPTPAPVPNGHDLTIGEQGKLALLQKLLTPDLDQDAIRAIARDEAHKASMTPDAVRDYIAKTLPDLIPVMRLEIKTPHAIKDLGEKARHKQFRELFLLVSARLSVMMVGPAGSGKTTACEQVAEALGLSFFVQGATTGTHELLGYKDAHGTYHTTAFRHAFEHGGFICMDEIDAGDAGAILVLNAALANGYMTFPDSPHPVKRHADFYVVACANTFGHGVWNAQSPVMIAGPTACRNSAPPPLPRRFASLSRRAPRFTVLARKRTVQRKPSVKTGLYSPAPTPTAAPALNAKQRKSDYGNPHHLRKRAGTGASFPHHAQADRDVRLLHLAGVHDV
jgi:ribosome modulation factor